MPLMPIDTPPPVSSPTAASSGTQAPEPLKSASESQRANPEAPAQTVQSDHNRATSQSSPGVLLSYRVDQQSKQPYFQLIDQSTGEVIRQIPPQEVLAFERQVTVELQKQDSKGEKTEG